MSALPFIYALCLFGAGYFGSWRKPRAQRTKEN